MLDIVPVTLYALDPGTYPMRYFPWSPFMCEKIESQLFSTSLLSTHLSEFVFSQLQHGVEETAAECRKLGATTHVFVVDCSNREEIYSSVDQVRLQRTHFSPWFYVPLHGIWKGSLWQPNLNLIFFLASANWGSCVYKEGHTLFSSIWSTQLCLLLLFCIISQFHSDQKFKQ